MKCPHCEYKNGWGWWPDDQGNENYSNVEGDFGLFMNKHPNSHGQSEHSIPRKSNATLALAVVRRLSRTLGNKLKLLSQSHQ